MSETKEIQYRGYDCLEFTVTCTMRRRWVPSFLAMLKRMAYLGSIGSSRVTGIYADGDGDFRPKFEFSDTLPVATVPETESGEMIYDAG